MLPTTLKFLASGKSLKQISVIEGKSIKTIKNRLSVAKLLGLVNKYQRKYYLTDLGDSFLQAGASDITEQLSHEQSNILADFVKESPFYSQITYTILSLVETVFILAKSSYPANKDDIEDFFVKAIGKEQTWKTPKARKTATYIFSNYACDLGFLSKIGDKFYLSPKGIQAILLLQLNRAIKLINN